MPGAVVADEMGLGKTSTSVAAAMIYQLLTEKVVMGLPQSILWGNIIAEWVNMVRNNFPGIVGEEREWYLLQRLNSFACHLLEMQTTQPYGHPALISAPHPVLVVTTSGVAESFKTVIDEMTHGTDFKLVNLLHTENVNPTHEDLNISIDALENLRNINLGLYDSLTSRATPSTNG
jgi:hypothetical protein